VCDRDVPTLPTREHISRMAEDGSIHPFLPPALALVRAIERIPQSEALRRRRAEEKAYFASILAACSVSGTSAQTCEERALDKERGYKPSSES
jgi:hypothetical protein